VIVAIVLACVLSAVATLVAAWILFEWWGILAFCLAATTVLTLYVRVLRPWHSTWGATELETSRAMPGDDIVPNAAATTRAISIGSSPKELWPWLVQIGYGRAGWYSYDWIDNDGKQSATRIVPELQHLQVGDMIEMLPGFGPRIVEVNASHHLVAGDGEGGSWCLAIYPEGEGSRLVSRWRQAWKSDGIGPKFFIALADPGAFIMEQKMLRGLKKRVEARGSSDDLESAGQPDLRKKEVA
jgi:hypothetical protein